MECELGRKEEGRRVFEELATNEFSDLPLDTHRLLSLAVLAEVAASLGDTGRAASLYELLLPHASWVVLDPHDFSAGPASRYLGLLASTMSRWEEAASHFEDALAMNERMRARPWVAHTQHDYARMLLTRDGPGDRERARDLLSAALETALDLGMTALESRVSMLGDAGGAVRPGEVSAPAGPQVFSREGEYWSIAYEGEAFRLKDAKGLRYLARLLAEPGREFHALDVVASGESGESSKLLRAQAEGPGVRSAGLGDAGEVLDRTAIEAYRRRLTDLEDEIEEAGAWADAERSARAREEKGFLEQELASAVGLGGRHRRAASASERARVAVTKAIRSALSRIRENAPSLGRHLDSTVRTGTYCSYRPDPRLPVSWRT
jgi:tetratricopeptide (TPR) repeat protein